jgi:hypothetical protein
MNTIIGPSTATTYTFDMNNNFIPIGYSNRQLGDIYYTQGNVAIGYPATVTDVNIAIGATIPITPSKHVKPCHKNCKVTWISRHDEPIIECQVHLQLAVWESFIGHPMYYPSKLPRDLFRLIADLIKDQEKGDYINITLGT